MTETIEQPPEAPAAPATRFPGGLPFDAFAIGFRRPACPACARDTSGGASGGKDGRVLVEQIHEDRVALSCDGCSWTLIVDRRAEYQPRDPLDNPDSIKGGWRNHARDLARNGPHPEGLADDRPPVPAREGCLASACRHPHYCKGLCKLHHFRWLSVESHGVDRQAWLDQCGPSRTEMKRDEPCLISGCEYPVFRNGLCTLHRGRWDNCSRYFATREEWIAADGPTAGEAQARMAGNGRNCQAEKKPRRSTPLKRARSSRRRTRCKEMQLHAIWKNEPRPSPRTCRELPRRSRSRAATRRRRWPAARTSA